MPHTPLRPTFTRLLLRKLREGRSINLVGLRGAGGSRALSDLQALALGEGFTAIRVDMNRYKYNYPGFIEEIQGQLLLPEGKKGKALPPPEAETAAAHPVSVVLGGQLSQHRQIVLLLDHFDALLDDPAQRLPKAFYDDLNSLRNREGISLCCATERPHLQYLVHYKDELGELAVTLSWLDLQHLDLPPLLEEEILAELERLLAGQPAWQEEKQKDKYITAVRGHRFPVRWMELLQENMEMEPDGFTADQRIRQATAKYGERYSNRPQARTNLDKMLERFVKFTEGIRNLRGKK